MVELCYRNFQSADVDTRETKMDQCIEKWKKVFAYMNS